MRHTLPASGWIARLLFVSLPVLAAALGCGPAGSTGATAGGMGGSTSASMSTGPESTGSGGADAGAPDPGVIMTLISRGVPAFASGSMSPPDKANDADPSSAWVSNGVPGWIAYDLSSVPSNERGDALVALYVPWTEDDFNNAPAAYMKLPEDYTVELNPAEGGAAPPASGWTEAAAVMGNIHSARQHLIDLGGAGWLRLTSTKSSDATAVSVDLDVYSAPAGAADDWLFMGDSITFISTPRAFSDLPALVAAKAPGHYPAVIDAAIGGTNTVTAESVIDATMADFPGRFVVLAYGTNDDPTDYRMESLVQKVLAAGKVPVVPRMPWSDTANIQTRGPILNQAIDALYTKYPQIVRGPDLWQTFTGRTDLIPSGDVHPNPAGQEVLRQAWADAMVKVYP